MEKQIELEKLNKQQLRDLINDLVIENEELKSETEKAQADCESAKAAAVKAAKVSEAYTRLLADFEAFKKRNAQISETAKADAAESIAKGLLPIMDNFQRAIDNIKDVQTKNGVQMIYVQIEGLLSTLGVQPFESLGCEFDHNLHDAITTQETKEENNNKVVSVFQQGYKMGDKIIRPAQVIVGKFEK